MKKTEIRIKLDKSVDEEEALREAEKIFEEMKDYETWVLATADGDAIRICGRVESQATMALIVARLMMESRLGPAEIAAALITLAITDQP